MTLTREQFDEFISGRGQHRNPPKVYVKPPYDVVPCACGDQACKGWRLVAVRPQPSWTASRPA